MVRVRNPIASPIGQPGSCYAIVETDEDKGGKNFIYRFWYDMQTSSIHAVIYRNLTDDRVSGPAWLDSVPTCA